MNTKQKRRANSEQIQSDHFIGKLFSVTLLVMLFLGIGGNQYDKLDTLITTTFVMWTIQDTGMVTSDLAMGFNSQE